MFTAVAEELTRLTREARAKNVPEEVIKDGFTGGSASGIPPPSYWSVFLETLPKDQMIEKAVNPLAQMSVAGHTDFLKYSVQRTTLYPR